LSERHRGALKALMDAIRCCAACSEKDTEVQVLAVVQQNSLPGFNKFGAEDTDQPVVPNAILAVESPELQKRGTVVYDEAVYPQDALISDVKMSMTKQYNITLTKKCASDRVSIDVDYGDGKTLKIRRVKDGLLKTFNDQHPDLQVVAGDVLIVINGKFGDSKELLHELLNAANLDILVKKVVPKDRSSALQKLAAAQAPAVATTPSTMATAPDTI